MEHFTGADEAAAEKRSENFIAERQPFELKGKTVVFLVLFRAFSNTGHSCARSRYRFADGAHTGPGAGGVAELGVRVHAAQLVIDLGQAHDFPFLIAQEEPLYKRTVFLVAT